MLKTARGELVGARKESDRAGGTHKLETAEGGLVGTLYEDV